MFQKKSGSNTPSLYPESLTLWKTHIAPEDRLTIINPGDFPKDAILRGLGINESPLTGSFGICDSEEISHRSAMIRLMLENPMLCKFVRNANSLKSLPLNQNGFLRQYDPSKKHLASWKTVHDLLRILKGCKQLPKRLGSLKKILEDNLPLEDQERAMAATLSKRILDVAEIEGVVQLHVDFGVNHSGKRYVSVRSDEDRVWHVHGYRQYSRALLSAGHHPYPNWFDNEYHPGNWLKFPRAWVERSIDRRNEREKLEAMRPMVIDSMNDAMQIDIVNAVKKHFESLDWHLMDSEAESPADELDMLRVEVKFSYDIHGLKIHTFNVGSGYYETNRIGLLLANFGGYSREFYRKIVDVKTRANQAINFNEWALQCARFRQLITQTKKDFFEPNQEIYPSPGFDAEHRWFALENCYASPEFAPLCEQLSQHRAFFNKHLAMLSEIAHLATKMQEMANMLGAPLCFPEILGSDTHLVECREVYPIHLFIKHRGNDGFDPSKLVPISQLPAINGQMIGLTGAHGGGKSSTQLSFTDNIYLAQSGLPVFGRDFRFNIKKMLGLIFLERGNGSTCEILVDKTINILKQIQGVNGNEVLLILDELGTGTQEDSGYELGRDLLIKLQKSGVSVLFSTQITTLAHFTVKELGAACFQINRDHQISPGIGDGGMRLLRQEKGLDQLLARN